MALSHSARGLVLALSLISVTSWARTSVPAPVPRPIPPILQVAQAKIPVQIKSLTIQSEIQGNHVNTIIDYHFYNPNSQILEGQLEFPLAEGQIVSGFSLDIDGQLRDAVAVPKDKAQQVFEEISRRRVDPGLLEKTEGNNYRIRVYPLPAGGERHVQITLQHNLIQADQLLYELPILPGLAVNEFNLKIKLNGVAAKQLRLLSALPDARIYQLGTDSVLDWQRKPLSAKGATLKLAIPTSQTDKHSYSYHQDQWYFQSQVKLPASWLVQNPTRPIKSINLIWDASGSAAQRDINKELSLLADFFKSVGEVSVNLSIARDQAEKLRHFQIRGGQWQELRKVLEQTAFDGATHAEALRPQQAADLTLLFSDGLINYGSTSLLESFAKFDLPVFAINTSQQADFTRLRAIAEQHGGELVMLNQIDTGTALRKLVTSSPYLLRIDSGQASEIISNSIYPQNGALTISGKLNAHQARLHLIMRLPNGKELSQELKLEAPQHAPGRYAAQAWAQAKIDRLSWDSKLNRQAIRQLAQSFNLLSNETSLLVLDNVNDYLRYEITPPPALMAEYQARLSKQVTQQSEDQRRHLEQMEVRFKQLYSWWQTDFPHKRADSPKTISRELVISGSSSSVMPAPAPTPQPIAEARIAEMPLARAIAPPPAPSMPAPMPSVVAERPAPRNAVEDGATIKSGNGQTTSSIQLQAWRADETYLQRLKQADPAQRYAIYLDERLSHKQSTAFYLDVADFFLEQNDLELGMRILSNLAEMQLENRQIFRVLAYRLMQAKRADLALPILQKVSILSPNEPQSFRDLAHAYVDLKNYQEAIAQLWLVASRKWDSRFPNIDLICLSEMNALIDRYQGLQLSQIDRRFILSMPLDLRVVLSWDADNTDIDLHVTDPAGETVYYGHSQSTQGGRISSDFTQGYGPETFSLRKAMPGVYKVYARFYGHRQQIITPSTSLMLKLTTDFGRANERSEYVVLRLKNAGDQVFVGEMTVPEKTSQQ